MAAGWAMLAAAALRSCSGSCVAGTATCAAAAGQCCCSCDSVVSSMTGVSGANGLSAAPGSAEGSTEGLLADCCCGCWGGTGGGMAVAGPCGGYVGLVRGSVESDRRTPNLPCKPRHCTSTRGTAGLVTAWHCPHSSPAERRRLERTAAEWAVAERRRRRQGGSGLQQPGALHPACAPAAAALDPPAGSGERARGPQQLLVSGAEPHSSG